MNGLLSEAVTAALHRPWHESVERHGEAGEALLAEYAVVAERAKDGKAFALLAELSAEAKVARTAFVDSLRPLQKAEEDYRAVVVQLLKASEAFQAGSVDPREAVTLSTALIVAEAKERALHLALRAQQTKSAECANRWGACATSRPVKKIQTVIDQTREAASLLFTKYHDGPTAALEKAAEQGAEADAETAQWWRLAEEVERAPFGQRLAEERSDLLKKRGDADHLGDHEAVFEKLWEKRRAARDAAIATKRANAETALAHLESGRA